jgi:hypothetical protein
MPFALTISLQTIPQPCSMQSRRNGISVIPAMGARKTLFFVDTSAIRICAAGFPPVYVTSFRSSNTYKFCLLATLLR